MGESLSYLDNLLPKLTSFSCHVTKDLERVSTLLRVDPVLAVSFRVSRVPDVLTGMTRLIGIQTFNA